MVPLITIITVVFNACRTIEKSIESVISQNYNNFEYVIIDGGSTDGTIDIIARYRKKIDYYLSEKDNGIYDAMNKGILASNGTYIYFLGADDFMYNADVIFNIGKQIKRNPYDVITGNVLYTSGLIVKPSFSYKLLFHNSVHHQGTFYNKKLFLNFMYNTQYKIISDYELNLILYLEKKQILQIDMNISICSDNGVSRNMINIMKAETNQIRAKHLPIYKAKFFQFLFNIKLYIWNAFRYN